MTLFHSLSLSLARLVQLLFLFPISLPLTSLLLSTLTIQDQDQLDQPIESQSRCQDSVEVR